MAAAETSEHFELTLAKDIKGQPRLGHGFMALVITPPWMPSGEALTEIETEYDLSLNAERDADRLDEDIKRRLAAHADSGQVDARSITQRKTILEYQAGHVDDFRDGILHNQGDVERFAKAVITVLNRYGDTGEYIADSTKYTVAAE